jgi:hypothetical protein
LHLCAWEPRFSFLMLFSQLNLTVNPPHQVHFIWGEDIPFKGSLLTTCPYKVPLRWGMQEHGEFPKNHKVEMWEL